MAKIYKQRYFELLPSQRKAYQAMEDELRIELLDGEIIPVSAIASLVKLQQITSGFVMVPGQKEPSYIGDGNPRLEAMMDLIEDLEGSKIIIWARFKEEIHRLSKELKAIGRKVVEYHGDIKKDQREEAVDSFQASGGADVFLGQPQSGGIGLTLTAAKYVIYYSQDFNLETRLQSEDRAHRIGTTEHVVYIDLVANDTIDEPISRSLQRKTDMAAAILDERRLPIQGNILRNVRMPTETVVT
jgi:SNF2 family DNA or RNA helicase